MYDEHVALGGPCLVYKGGPTASERLHGSGAVLHNVQTLSEVNQIHPSLSAGPMGASSRATESYCTRATPSVYIV